MTEMAGIDDPTAHQAGPGVVYQGHIGIEWPAPAEGSASLVMPGWKFSVWDALNGKPITTVTKIEVHVPANGLVTADLTMFADLDGQPVYDGKPHIRGQADLDGEIVTGTFPFLVAEMRVARPAPERGPLEPWFVEPCAS